MRLRRPRCIVLLLMLLASGASSASAAGGACGPAPPLPRLGADAGSDVHAQAWLERAASERRRGSLDSASEALERAAPQVDRCESAELRSRLHLERGLLLRARGDHAAAADVLERVSGPRAGLARVLTLDSRSRLADPQIEPARIASAREDIAGLPSSRDRAHASLRLAGVLERLAGRAADTADLLRAAAADLERARETASAANAPDLEARALAALSRLYALDGRAEDAERLARRALFAARVSRAPGAEHEVHVQLARLARGRGDRTSAIASLRAAVDLRRDFPPATAEAGARAREAQLELVDLLLGSAARSGDPPELLREARDVLESLKADELRDYFDDPCAAPRHEVRAEAIAGAVVVYPVALPDRLELIVGRDGKLLRRRARVSADDLAAAAHRMRRLLEKRTTREYRHAASELYDWLVRPLADVLAAGPVEALVFVPGGALRTLPPAALIDRESGQHLIEQYPVAISPGLDLTDPRALAPTGASVLAAGLSESVAGFAALPHVAPELDALDRIWNARVLVDDGFRISAFENAVRAAPFDVVHVASHAHFDGQREGSFLLAWDGRLSIDQLARLVRTTRHRGTPIELLALSACETAAGDERAALGLAGVAVRAGARSALATLWPVNDRLTRELVERFYAELRAGTSRARALQLAQLDALARREYRHPAFWAPFLLISSWL